MSSLDLSPKSASSRNLPRTRGSFQWEGCQISDLSMSTKKLGPIGTPIYEDPCEKMQASSWISRVENNQRGGNVAFKASQPNWALHNYCCKKVSPLTPLHSYQPPQTVNPLCEGLIRKNKKEKKYFNDLVEEVQGGSGLVLLEDQIIQMSPQELLNLMTSDKASAVALQVLLGQCSYACKATIQSVVSENMELLLVHRTGSYLVQKLLSEAGPCFTEKINNICQKEFNKLVSNEFASRVMQKMLEVNEAFKTSVLDRLKTDLSPYVKDFSAVFLVSGAVQAADTDKDRAFVKDTLAQNPKKWLINKYFKRVFVTYLQTCSLSDLADSYVLFKSGTSLFASLEEKYCSLVLLTFVERGLLQAQEDILELLHGSCAQIIGIKYFGYFISQLLRKCSVREFVRRVDRTLRNVVSVTFKSLMVDPSLYKIYSSVIIEIQNFICSERRSETEATLIQ